MYQAQKQFHINILQKPVIRWQVILFLFFNSFACILNTKINFDQFGFWISGHNSKQSSTVAIEKQVRSRSKHILFLTPVYV